MVKSKSELIEQVKAVLGENDSDEALSLLEDVSDTLTDFETKTDGEDWKKKYEENDKAWRTKYKERFSAPVGKSVDTENDDLVDDTGETIEEEKPLTFENLFTTEGK